MPPIALIAHAVMMPSDYTASMSVDDSREMAKIHGVKYTEIAIKPIFDAFREQLAPSFAGKPEDTTEENLQSRIRGTLGVIAGLNDQGKDASNSDVLGYACAMAGVYTSRYLDAQTTPLSVEVRDAENHFELRLTKK